MRRGTHKAQGKAQKKERMEEEVLGEVDTLTKMSG